MSLIQDVAAELLQIPATEISDETSPKNTKSWDSMKHIELVMAIEIAFGVKFTPSEIVLIDSIGAIRSLLATKGAEIAA